MPVQNFLPPSLFTETGQTYNGPDTTYPWYFNVVQLKATLRDLAELKQPNFRYFFCNRSGPPAGGPNGYRSPHILSA
jgi:hypothetical protein